MTQDNYQRQGTRQGTVVFIDENLHDKKIGVLSIVWPPVPQQIISRIREQYNMYDEMKWSTVSRLKVPFLSSVIEEFFVNKSFGRINVSSIDDTVDNAIFNTLNSIKMHCSPYHGIFIDNHTTPRGYNFERKLRYAFNCNCVMRLDSKATELLQLCDLLLNLVVRANADELPLSPHKVQLIELFKGFYSRAIFDRCFYS